MDFCILQCFVFSCSKSRYNKVTKPANVTGSRPSEKFFHRRLFNRRNSRQIDVSVSQTFDLASSRFDVERLVKWTSIRRKFRQLNRRWRKVSQSLSTTSLYLLPNLSMSSKEMKKNHVNIWWKVLLIHFEPFLWTGCRLFVLTRFSTSIR